MRQTEQVQRVLNQLTEYLKQHGGVATFGDYRQARMASHQPIGMSEMAILSNLPHVTDAIGRRYKTHDSRVDTLWYLIRKPAAVE